MGLRRTRRVPRPSCSSPWRVAADPLRSIVSTPCRTGAGASTRKSAPPARGLRRQRRGGAASSVRTGIGSSRVIFDVRIETGAWTLQRADFKSDAEPAKGDRRGHPPLDQLADAAHLLLLGQETDRGVREGTRSRWAPQKDQLPRFWRRDRFRSRSSARRCRREGSAAGVVRSMKRRCSRCQAKSLTSMAWEARRDSSRRTDASA